MARDEVSRNLAAINDEISKINTALKSATKETNALGKAFKLDPKNVQLAATYADSLAKRVELARQKTELLRQKQAEMAKSNPIASTTEEYKKLTTAIVQAESEVRVLNKKIAETNNTKLSNLQSGLAGVARAATVILGAVVAIGVAFATAGDEIDKYTNKYNVSAETYQRWANIFKQTLGGTDSYVQSLQQMTNLMGQIEKGSGKMLSGLEAMGVTIDQLKGKSPQELLEFILELLSSIEDEDERLTAAASIFGSYGAELATVAGLTAGEVAELNDELTKSGIITAEQAKKAAALKDAFDNLSNTFKAAIVDVGEQLVPMFMALIQIIQVFIPILSTVAAILNFIGPAGQVIVFLLLAIVAILPQVAALLKAVNIITTTLNITVGALVVKLLIVMGIVIAIGLLLQAIFGQTYSLDVDTSGASNLLEDTNATIYGVGANGTTSETEGSTINNVVYNDYSTTNVTAETEADLDDIIEGLNAKVIQVGGK